LDWPCGVPSANICILSRRLRFGGCSTAAPASAAGAAASPADGTAECPCVCGVEDRRRRPRICGGALRSSGSLAVEDSIFAAAVAREEAPRSWSGGGFGGMGAERAVLEEDWAGCGLAGLSEASMGERGSRMWSTTTSPRMGTAVGSEGPVEGAGQQPRVDGGRRGLGPVSVAGRRGRGLARQICVVR